MTFSVSFPLHLRSALNAREHWAARHRRVRAEREAVDFIVRGSLHGTKLTVPCAVTITRLAPRMLDAGDNLESSAKGVRDQIAHILGVDDRDPRVTWCVKQEKAKTYSVRIVVEPT